MIVRTYNVVVWKEVEVNKPHSPAIISLNGWMLKRGYALNVSTIARSNRSIGVPIRNIARCVNKKQTIKRQIF